MASALILTAATIGKINPGASLDSVQRIADAITPLMGLLGGKILFAVGITSAALIAAIVVSWAAPWGVNELLNAGKSFNMSVKDAPGFYAGYTCSIIATGLFVFGDFHLVGVDHPRRNGQRTDAAGYTGISLPSGLSPTPCPHEPQRRGKGLVVLNLYRS